MKKQIVCRILIASLSFSVIALFSVTDWSACESFFFRSVLEISRVETHRKKTSANSVIITPQDFSPLKTKKHLPEKFVTSFSMLPVNKWPVIVYTTKGRFANALFQYGLAIATQQEFPGVVVGITEKVYNHIRNFIHMDVASLHIFPIKFLRESHILLRQREPDYETGDFGSFLLKEIQDAVFNFQKYNIQSILEIEAFDYSFLQKYRNKVIQQMPIKRNIAIQAQKYFEKVKKTQLRYSKNATFVGVHVRRSDFLFTSVIFYKHQVPSDKYVERALSYFRNYLHNPIFILRTDDVTYSKQIFGHNEDVIVSSSYSKEKDLAILASCSHMVITMGTFGFWAAFVTEGKVIFPLFKASALPKFDDHSKIQTWPDPRYENYKNFEGFPAF